MSAAVQSIWSPVKLPKIAYGKGSYLYDTDGKQYIDGSGGPAVFCLGHGNEEVNQAIKAQLDRIAHGYRYTFTSDPLEQLTEMVRRACGANSGLTRMIFVSSGSEAVESCLKIALQYHSARGEQTRRQASEDDEDQERAEPKHDKEPPFNGKGDRGKDIDRSGGPASRT